MSATDVGADMAHAACWGASEVGQGIFSTFHPGVPFCYLACALALSMASSCPWCVALALAGSVACSCAMRGVRATCRTLAGALPLWGLALLVNPLVSHSGSTELLRLGPVPVQLEAVAYGACSGAMLAAAVMWFACYGAEFTSERTTELLGGALPGVSLMVSQMMRLVPQMLRRGREVGSVRAATTAAGATTAASGRMRTLTVLMGWSMEDGLERSDAMRARGYGSGPRTRYRRVRLRPSDVACIVLVAALAAASLAFVLASSSRFRFYPAISFAAPGPGIAAYVAFLLVPVAAWGREAFAWRSSR